VSSLSSGVLDGAATTSVEVEIADEEDATVWTVVGTTLNIAPILVVLAGGQTAPPKTEVEDANTDETTTLKEEDPDPPTTKSTQHSYV
jgi:hypothetical protein